jgi:hypothetical protein
MNILFKACVVLLSSWVLLAFALPEEELPLEVSLQKLADIEYEPGDDIDKDVLVYNEQRVRITGYMRNGTTEGETWFDLTNDSCGCGTSKLQHFVRVTMTEGKTHYDPAELDLTGVLEVGEVEDEDGFVESIYRLTIGSLDQ